MIVAALVRLSAPPAGMTSFTDAEVSPRNADSVSVNGVEVGVAHDAVGEARQVTTRLLQQAAVTARRPA